MGDGVELMIPKGDFGVHARKRQVLAVIFPRAHAVKPLIVCLHQIAPPIRVLPNPVPKGVLDGLLLLLRDGRFLAVEDAALLTLPIADGIIDAHIPQIQRVLQYLIGVCPVRAVGHVGVYVVVRDVVFAADIPFSGKLGEVNVQTALCIRGRVEQLKHELLDIPPVNPGRAEPHLDL